MLMCFVGIGALLVGLMVGGGLSDVSSVNRNTCGMNGRELNCYGHRPPPPPDIHDFHRHSIFHEVRAGFNQLNNNEKTNDSLNLLKDSIEKNNSQSVFNEYKKILEKVRQHGTTDDLKNIANGLLITLNNPKPDEFHHPKYPPFVPHGPHSPHGPHGFHGLPPPLFVFHGHPHIDNNKVDRIKKILLDYLKI